MFIQFDSFLLLTFYDTQISKMNSITTYYTVEIRFMISSSFYVDFVQHNGRGQPLTIASTRPGDLDHTNTTQ
jgi:hypothetical protein